ncbi:caspase family protein [Polyangium sp. 6x1]|uniref:caspase family protein n=1 Tax=Polyangium sp. 6x1 TaxID=3042689 RepID=UPI002482E3BE|nr:caspase family protein [Polyangium sp. 6x1]MDI1451598.1 caspase family protein [Polyangium sp. 6x1]
MKALWILGVFLAILLDPTFAWARIERFAVLIGNNAGAPGDVELRYAESDAARVHEVLKDLGGFPPANMVLLRGEGADTVRATLIAMNDRIRQAAAPDVQIIAVVYYSGHADATALHLGKTTLDLAQLEQLVRGSAASFRVLVLDACRSGALTRVKGGSPAAPVDIRIDGRLAGEGVVFLTASSANEDAQESDALKGSFFTHYFVSGLMGAADDNGDGFVELEEAYDHAYDNTLRASSRTLAGTQHPTFRYELRGQGKVLLTSLPAGASGRATLELPAGRSYLLFGGSNAGPVVAEVSARDVARKISLKPGTYFVRGRDKDYLLEGSITLNAGQAITLRDDALTQVAYARLVRKGQARAGAVHGPQAGYRLRTPFWKGASSCHGIFAGYAIETEHLSVTPRLGACRGSFTNDVLSANTDELDLSVRLAHAWDFPIVSLDLGISAGAALLYESFVTRGVAPARASLAGHVGAGLAATFDLPAGFYLLGEAAAETYFFRQENAADPRRSDIAAAFAMRLLGGAGKRF